MLLLSPTHLEIMLGFLPMSLARILLLHDSDNYRKAYKHNVFELKARSGFEFSLGFVVSFMEIFD